MANPAVSLHCSEKKYLILRWSNGLENTLHGKFHEWTVMTSGTSYGGIVGVQPVQVASSM